MDLETFPHNLKVIILHTRTVLSALLFYIISYHLIPIVTQAPAWEVCSQPYQADRASRSTNRSRSKTTLEHYVRTRRTPWQQKATHYVLLEY